MRRHEPVGRVAYLAHGLVQGERATRWHGRASSSTPASTSSTATGATRNPRADDENAYLASHTWQDYGEWHLALTDGATDETKARYAFVYGDFRRVHRMGLIACEFRAAEWRHKEVELAAHDLLQHLDKTSA